MKKTLSVIIIGLLCFSTFSMLAPRVEAAAVTLLSVQPTSIIDPALGLNSIFRINITVANVQNLWGYQFAIGYNTSVLTATNFGLYLPFENFFPSGIFDSVGCVALAACTYMGDLVGFSTIEPKAIAWIEFIVDDVGMSVLDLYVAWPPTGYFDPNPILVKPWRGETIPHEHVDGLFDNRPWTPTPLPQLMVKPVKGEITHPWNAFHGYYNIKDYLKGDPYLKTLVFKEGFHSYIEDITKNGKDYERWMVYHEGIDILQVKGTPVNASASGTIVYVCNRVERERGGPGKWIMIWHGDITKQDGTLAKRISTRYLHLDTIDDYILEMIKKQKNVDPANFKDWVEIPITQGMRIGTVGNTGCAGVDPHLHFEVRQEDDRYNWKTYLPYNTLPLNPCEFVDYKGYTTPPEKPTLFQVLTSCLVDLIVTDPDGLIISKEINQLPTLAQYIEVNNGIVDEEIGEAPHDAVIIHERKIGRYQITVIPEPGTIPTDTYNLQVFSAEATLILAENVPISNIPTHAYILESSETEVIPIMPATVDFDPDTLNLKSTGLWVTAYIELPVGHGYNINQIDVSSLKLNDTIPALSEPTQIGDYDGDGIADLMVKFDRVAIIQWLGAIDYSQDTGKSCTIKVTITGTVNGVKFEGSDIIRILKK